MSSRQINSVRLLLVFVLGLSVILFSPQKTQAAIGILPGGAIGSTDGSVTADALTEAGCSVAVDQWDASYAENGYNGMPDTATFTIKDEESGSEVQLLINSEEMLACAIKSGNMHFWMVPYFVNYALEFVINVAGILVVLMIVVGGYYYIYGAVTDDKEKGKTIIMYAVGGYALVLVSWFIVNAVLLAVTQ